MIIILPYRVYNWHMKQALEILIFMIFIKDFTQLTFKAQRLVKLSVLEKELILTAKI